MRIPLAPLAGAASIGLAAMLGACAADPAVYRIEATSMPFPGLPGGSTATAIRTSSGWTLTRQGFYRGSRPERVRLTRAEALALDAAVADPALYLPPQPLPGGCIDPDFTTLEVTANGSSQQLVLECATAPGITSVLRILFGWGKEDE